MNFTRIYLCLIVLFIYSCGQSARTDIKPNEKHKLEISGCEAFYNGKRLKLGAPIEGWITILGPCRIYGRWYIWDEIGVAANLESVAESTVDGSLVSGDNVRELKIFFQNYNDIDKSNLSTHEVEFLEGKSPKKTFSGGMWFNGILLGRRMEESEIKQRIKESKSPLELEYIGKINNRDEFYAKNRSGDSSKSIPHILCDGRELTTIISLAINQEEVDDITDISKFSVNSSLESIEVDVHFDY